jgi:hypothetical protein
MLSANVYLHDWDNCRTNTFRNLIYETVMLKSGLLLTPVPEPHTTVGTHVVISAMNYL